MPCLLTKAQGLPQKLIYFYSTSWNYVFGIMLWNYAIQVNREVRVYEKHRLVRCYCEKVKEINPCNTLSLHFMPNI